MSRLDAIDEEIKRLLTQVEALGDEGKIEESEACIIQVESLKKRKEEMKLTGDPSMGGSNRQMKVCEICGAMQALNDTEKRSQAHYEGKLHTGFAILRTQLELLKKRREELRNMDLISRKEKQKEEKEKDGEKSPERNDSKRNRTHSRSPKRDRKHRSRSRSKSREKKPKYDRERDRDRRDRDRDRRDRDRDR